MVSRDRKRWQWVVERLRRFKNIRFVPNDFLDEEDQLLKEIVEYVIDSLDSEEKIYITRKYFAEERPLHEIHIRNRIIGVKPEGLKRIKFSAYSKIEKALQSGFWEWS